MAASNTDGLECTSPCERRPYVAPRRDDVVIGPTGAPTRPANGEPIFFYGGKVLAGIRGTVALPHFLGVFKGSTVNEAVGEVAIAS